MTSNKTETLKQIAERAERARGHLVEALRGLDEIIRLAEKAGRDDVRLAAEAAKAPVKKAAKAFNEEVGEVGGNAAKIDPIVIDETEAVSSKALTQLQKLYDKLKERVDGIETNVAQWGFGPERDGDRPIPTKGTWADWANFGLENHERRIAALENRADDGFDMGLFALSVAIGAVVGFLLGLFALWANFGLAGPVGGIFIGAVAGAIVGLWLGNRTKSTNSPASADES